MSTLDFCVMIELAQRYRNYKLACQFIQDIYRLDTQPTLQVYEVSFSYFLSSFSHFFHLLLLILFVN